MIYHTLNINRYIYRQTYTIYAPFKYTYILYRTAVFKS